MRCQEPLHISTGELHAFERRSGLDKLKIAGYIFNYIYYIRNTCINRAWLNWLRERRGKTMQEPGAASTSGPEGGGWGRKMLVPSTEFTSAKEHFAPCVIWCPLRLSFTFCWILYNLILIGKIPFFILKKKILILISVKYRLFLSSTDGDFTYQS